VRPRAAALLAALLAAAAACAPTAPVDVRLSIPARSPFPPGSLKAILVTDFHDQAPLPDLETGHALGDQLESELARAARGTTVRIGRAPVPAGAGRDDAAAWKAAGGGEGPGAVFLAGTVSLAAKVLKAVDKTQPGDGPFDLAGRGLVAKRRWTFAADVRVISAATGETIYRRAFLEERDYTELDKPAEFAFHELSERFRAKLFQALLGTPTLETRTLLRR